MSCPNGISPLLLPITNYTISSNGFTTSRGIQFGIGTPQQLMTAVPGISDSNLVIPNLQYCGSASNYSCVGSLGGAYTPKKSSTYVQTTEAQWNGTFSSAVAQGSNALIFFEDVLDFGASGYAYGFPSISPGPQYYAAGTFPLGQNSTFLKAAVETHLAPSQTYGIFPGSFSVDDPLDGMVVVGGYDAARVAGNFTSFHGKSIPGTQQFFLASIDIATMTYEAENVSLPLLSADSAPLTAVMDTSVEDLYIPQNIWDKFANATGGTYNAYLQRPIYTNSTPNGTLSIVLTNGYKTKIPTTELFMYPRYYDESGRWSIYNNTYKMARVTNFTVEGQPAIFGLPYSTMNYFLVDNDARHLQMAPANRQAPPPYQSLAPDIRPICAKTSPHSPASTGAASSSSSSPSSNHHSSHTGAIAGGVVGGILGLAAVAGVIFFLLRRRRTNQRNNERPPKPIEKDVRPDQWRTQPQRGGSALLGDKAEKDGHELHEVSSSSEFREADSGAPVARHEMP